MHNVFVDRFWHCKGMQSKDLIRTSSRGVELLLKDLIRTSSRGVELLLRTLKGPSGAP